ncbi:phosphate acetyltransferase [Aurantimonas sp. E1-2-R+4]|uniref:phosphate acetyltransferase n=1 Tax=Aurantimonas sp. E1-2-R+4 TaxID=3113714 RepID=UPI002F93F697
MKPLDDIIIAAKTSPKHIVLPEGEDARIIEGAARAVREGIARITLLGDPRAIAAKLDATGLDPASVAILDPTRAPQTADYAAVYHKLRRHKGVDEAAAKAAMTTPLGFAAMMVRQGDADGTVGGAIATTADTVRTALQIIGRAPQAKIVSSFFLMMLCEHHHTTKGGFVFADCGMIVEPSVEELAEIAIASADSYAELIREEPRVAMLSFSTGGSAKHERVSRVAAAADLVKTTRADIKIHGDLQFDAAFVPAVSAAKSAGSPLEGLANVMVFPNLDAANIGYKIAQRIGGAKAIGPILQGLAKPANDLSRGCSADDVFHIIAVTCVQAIAAATAAGPAGRRKTEPLAKLLFEDYRDEGE